MPSYTMQILIENIEAEDENEAMRQFLDHVGKSFRLDVNIFIDDEFLCTHSIIRADTNDSGSIH